MNPSASEASTTVSPTITCSNIFQQFSQSHVNQSGNQTSCVGPQPLSANINAAVIAAAHQLLPKVNGTNIMALFTVEQLELIRRLRLTGISADAVLQAFYTLEKMETDFGASSVQSFALSALMGTSPKLFSPESLKPDLPQQLQIQNPVISTASPTLLRHLSTQAFAASNNNNSGMPPLSTPLAPLSGLNTPRTPPNLSPEHRTTFTTVPFASTATEMPFFFPSLSSQLHPAHPSSSSPSTSNNSGGRPIRSQRTPMKEITTLDDPTELEEFMAQGEEGCINDMKQFITQYSLRQTTVAMMTGVSQPYISKLLNGNHRELSLRCRKNIYSWYLNCRRHPSKLAAFLQDPSTRLETNGDGELIPQRRERYVFRPILIKILENFFAEMPFPDYAKRVDIASACNSALQMDKKGAGLMPKEIVSPQVVSNWFANKRKELRRKSNEEPHMPSGLALFQQQHNALSSSNSVDEHPSPLSSCHNSPVSADMLESHALDAFSQQQYESLKNVFNFNNLYNLKQQLSTSSSTSSSTNGAANTGNENVNFMDSTSSSPIEFDKVPTNFLQNLIGAYQQGSQFTKIEQTAE